MIYRAKKQIEISKGVTISEGALLKVDERFIEKLDKRNFEKVIEGKNDETMARNGSVSR